MSEKTLVVAEVPTRLFVAGVALATVDLARILGTGAQSVFLAQLDQCLAVAIQDQEGRYSLEDRKGLKALHDLLHEHVGEIPSREH